LDYPLNFERFPGTPGGPFFPTKPGRKKEGPFSTTNLPFPWAQTFLAEEGEPLETKGVISPYPLKIFCALQSFFRRLSFQTVAGHPLPPFPYAFSHGHLLGGSRQSFGQRQRGTRSKSAGPHRARAYKRGVRPPNGGSYKTGGAGGDLHH